MDTVQNGNEVKIEQLETQPVVSIRRTVQVADLGTAMGENVGTLSAYLKQRGVQPSGPAFVRYHTFGETETDFELGVPVAAPEPGEGQVAAGELPGGPAVTTSHVGAHDKLGEAYGRLHGWLKEQGREAAGPGWEVYYWLDVAQASGPESFPDAEEWRTELVQPIK